MFPLSSSRASTIAYRSLLCVLLIPGITSAETSSPGQDASKNSTQSSAKVMNLEQLLSFADENSPLLTTSRAQVEVAQAQEVGAAPLFPSNPEFSGKVGSRSNGQNSGLQFQLELSQQIELAGQPFLRKKAARKNSEALGLSAAQAQWAVHVEVHRLFNELLLAQIREEQAARFVEFSSNLQSIAQRQVDTGESSPLSLLVADADLAQTQSERIEVQRQRQAIETQLRATIGWKELEHFRIDGQLPGTTSAPQTSELLRLMAKHHPSLKVRQAAIESSRAMMKLQRREVWPDPSIGIQYGQEPGLNGQNTADIWLFTFQVPIPVWQRNQGPVAESKAKLAVAESEQQQTQIELQSQVELAAHALSSSAARVQLYEAKVIPKLEENLRALERAYELGEVDLLQVSQTRERLLSASKLYLDARVDYFRAAATLEGFIGTELRSHTQEHQ